MSGQRVHVPSELAVGLVLVWLGLLAGLFLGAVWGQHINTGGWYIP